MEFDNLMYSALNEDKEVPKALNDKLLKKVKAKNNYKKLLKAVPMSAAACMIAGIAITAILYNNQGIVEFPNNDNSNNIIVGNILEDETFVEQEIDVVEEKTKPVIRNTQKNNSKKVKTVESQEKTQNENNNNLVVTNVTEEASANFDKTNNDEVDMARVMTREVSLLIDYVENDEVLLENISNIIKNKISEDDSIEYYEFNSVSGFESYEVTDSNELVVIFEAGVIAPYENGEIYFNVGTIK